MPLRTLLFVIIFLILTIPSYGQFLERFTFEAGYNKSKIFNLQKITSFEIEERKLAVQHEHEPVTWNMSTSIGYSITKKHHLRLRRSKTILGSILTAQIEISDPFGNSFSRPIQARDTKIISTSLGIIYEYHSTFQDGNLVFGLGAEKQKNRKSSELLVLPGLRFNPNNAIENLLHTERPSN